MRKTLLIIILSILTHSINAADVYIGPKIGLNASTFKLSNVSAADQVYFKEYKKFYVGPNVGLDFLFKINNYVALQTELNFTMKGIKYKYKDNYSFDRYMQLDVPIICKGGYGKDNWFVYGSFGTDVSVNLIHDYVEKVASNPRTKERIGFKYTSRVDFGIAMGVGGMYKLGKGSLDVELRGNIGLINQDKFPGETSKLKWRSLSFNVAYLLPLWNK